MKKTIKLCGSNQQTNNGSSAAANDPDANKTLITTKQQDDYLEKNTIEFKDGIATTINTVMTFTDEKKAKEMYNFLGSFKSNPENAEMTIELNGKEIVTNNLMYAYSSFYKQFEGKTTRKDIKAEYEAEEYTVE
jgi:hypothetical protein